MIMVLSAGLLALLAVALITLANRDQGEPPRPAEAAATVSSTPVPRPSETRVATLRLLCAAQRCPVFVRVPGGDILIDQDLTAGQEVSYFEPRLDVVLNDAGAVHVLENGKERPAGEPGKRAEFQVKRD